MRVFALRARRRGPGGPDGSAAGAFQKRPQERHRAEVRCNILVNGVVVLMFGMEYAFASFMPNPANALSIK
jgi:hypothetical protein